MLMFILHNNLMGFGNY